jgi:hypothetical protein
MTMRPRVWTSANFLKGIPRSGVAVIIDNISNMQMEVGASFSFTPTADNQGAFAITFSLIGTVPSGIDIDPLTGEIYGQPDASALMTNLREYTSIVVRATYAGTGSPVDSNEFNITVVGTELSVPIRYLDFNNSVNDFFGATGTVNPDGGGNGDTFATYVAGNVSQALSLTPGGGSDFYIGYGPEVSAGLNNASGVTLAMTIASVASPGGMLVNTGNVLDTDARIYAEITGGGNFLFGGRSEDGEFFQSVTSDSNSFLDGDWHSLIGTIEFVNNINVYIDGVLDSFVNEASFNLSAFEEITQGGTIRSTKIGQYTATSGSSDAIDIWNDEFALWDCTLNEYEIATVAWLQKSR